MRNIILQKKTAETKKAIVGDGSYQPTYGELLLEQKIF
jgi:hypothetical protein